MRINRLNWSTLVNAFVVDRASAHQVLSILLHRYTSADIYCLLYLDTRDFLLLLAYLVFHNKSTSSIIGNHHCEIGIPPNRSTYPSSWSIGSKNPLQILVWIDLSTAIICCSAPCQSCISHLLILRCSFFICMRACIGAVVVDILSPHSSYCRIILLLFQAFHYII